MANPIFREDLLGADEIKKMIKHFTDLAQAAEDSIKRIQSEASSLQQSLKGVNVTQAEQREKIKSTAKEAAKLEAEMAKYNNLLSDNAVKLAGVKNAQRQLNQINKLEAKLLASKKGSYNALSAQYSINKIKLNQMSAEERNATKSGKELEKQTAEIYEEMKRLQEATGKHALSVGDYGKAFDGLKAPIDGAIAKMRAFMANPIGAVIAAIAGAFLLLKNAMTRSEEGQDRLNKIMRVAGAAFQVVMDIVADFAVALFDGIPAAIQKAGNRIQTFVKSTKAGFLELRIGLNEFLGDTEEADGLKKQFVALSEEIVNLQKENKELDTILGNTFGAAIENASNFGQKLKDNVRDSALLADLEAARNREERRVLIANAKLSKQAADLKAQAEETKKTAAEQSLQALEEAVRIEEKVLQNELRLERVRLNILKRESALGKDDLEAKKAIAEQTAAVINAEAALLQNQRTAERELQEFRAEAFGQEQRRQKTRLDILKANNNIESIELQRIADSERNSVDQRIAAIEELNARRIQEAQQAFAIEKAQLDKELELKKISYQDYILAIELLNVRKTEAFTQSTDEEIKALEKLGDALYKEVVEPLEVLTNDPVFDQVAEKLKQIKKDINTPDSQEPTLFERIFGEDATAFQQSMQQAFSFAKQQLMSFMQERVRIADEMVAQAEREQQASQASVQNAQSALQAELQRAEQGLANRADTAQAELDIAQQQAAVAKQNQEKALRQQQKAQKEQRKIQALEQTGNLITATAKIWSTFANPIFALPAIGIMWGSFAAAQLRAAKLSKREFAEGGLEILGGGSHASGNDTYLGFQSQGKPAYAEKDEAIAIINRRNTRKYRSLLPELVRSLNNGTFENRFVMANQSTDNIPMIAVNSERTDTSKMEEHLQAIRSQNDLRVYSDGKGNRIQIYKNVKTYYAD